MEDLKIKREETGNTVRLAQKVSYATKSANDFEYMKRTMDYYINSISNTELTEMETLSRVRSGTMVASDYTYVTNGFGFKKEEHKKFPAKLRNYPLTEPVCELFLGEYNKRPRIETVVALNSDIENAFKKQINLEVEQFIQGIFLEELNRTDVSSIEGKEVNPEEEQAKLEQLMANINTGIDDKLAILGQDTLDYLYYHLNLTDKHQHSLDNYLTYGRTFNYKNVDTDEVTYEVVPPEEITIPIIPGVSYVNDYDTVIRTKLRTLSQIIDEYYDKGLVEHIEFLENEAINGGNINAAYQRVANSLFKQQEEEKNKNATTHDYEVYHVVFPSYKEIGILTRLNELGEAVELEVDEDYKLDEAAGDINLEKLWIKELWEGTRIGTYVYLDIKPIAIQGTELSNRSKTINPYGGLVVRNKVGGIQSIVKTSLPYQALWNVYHYQHEMIMNKNKDKILFMPLGLVPKKQGWTEDKFMYTAVAGSFAFYDETAPNAASNLQGIKSVDMSLSKYAADMYKLLQLMREEYWDAVGVNRQRFGDTMASDGKGVTEQAIFRSTLTTEELYRRFDKGKEEDANVLLLYAKVAFINGKKRNFVMSDGSVKLLEVLGPEFALADLGVFAKNGGDEYEKLQKFQNLGLTLLQNSVTVGLLADMLDANNFSKVKEIAKKAEKVIQQAEERKNQIAEASIKSSEEIAAQAEANKTNLEMYKADLASDTAIEVAHINHEGGEKATVDTTSKDNLEREKFNHVRNMDNRKLEFEKGKQSDKMVIENKKLNKPTTKK